MIYIAIALPPHLPSKWAYVVVTRAPAFANLQGHAARSAYLKTHASWRSLKVWLGRQSHDKCWYCETKSTRAPFDVDHFRPKLRVTVDGVALVNHGGYHWLAYDWSNFRLSCTFCNRPNSDDDTVFGKSNEFPIRDEATRSTGPSVTHAKEEPRLLDPCVAADCNLLAHPIDGEVRAAAEAGTWEAERAEYTIGVLGLNAAPLPEEKRRRWNPLNVLIMVSQRGDLLVQSVIQSNLEPSSEYSSYLRACIATHRTKPWIKNLL